ncbi:MAG: ABC transporter substrate-binding protein [Deltaproteobacteria bacterium]|nr:ABC transporter substrate-binding protein [Deltaproteobacteria bacterium]
MTSEARAGRSRARRIAISASAVILLGVLLFTLRFVGPAAPGEVQLLTGPPGSSLHELGERYAAYLEKRGLRARVVETDGSFDNLLRLADGDASMAGFVQSAVDREVEDRDRLADLVSLGSLYYQPFWFFVHGELEIESLADLDGRRVARGHAGGGARAVARLLLDKLQLSGRVVSTPYDALEPDAAADALVAGEIDAACFIGEPHDAVISRLVGSDSVSPVSLGRTAALANLYRGLAPLLVPEGALDLVRNVPDADLHLISPAANLATREDLHPAVVDLLLDAAKEIQREPTLFSRSGDFPSMDHVSLPLSPAARRYYQQGPSRMRQVLPFWLATAINRFTVVVVPMLTVAFGLFKLLPIVIQARFKIQSLGFYKRLTLLEKAAAEGEDLAGILTRLDDIDRESAAIAVPRPCLTPFLELRQYIHDMRERLTTG